LSSGGTSTSDDTGVGASSGITSAFDDTSVGMSSGVTSAFDDTGVDDGTSTVAAVTSGELIQMDDVVGESDVGGVSVPLSWLTARVWDR
jgi:hypothetical protein